MQDVVSHARKLANPCHDNLNKVRTTTCMAHDNFDIALCFNQLSDAYSKHWQDSLIQPDLFGHWKPHQDTTGMITVWCWPVLLSLVGTERLFPQEPLPEPSLVCYEVPSEK